jgi:conjugal transfer ATP-binding protein TraC
LTRDKRACLGDKLPFWHFDDDILVFSDGSLGAGFKVSGVDTTAVSVDFVNEVSQQLENLMNTAEEGLRFQVFYRLTPHVAERLDEHERLTGNDGDGYHEIAKSRFQFLRSHAAAGNYNQPELYFFIRNQPCTYRKRKFFESAKAFQSLSEKDYSSYREKFLRNVKQLESSLSHAKQQPKRISSQEWFSLLYEFLNLSRSEGLASPELRKDVEANPFSDCLSDQLALTDHEAHRDHIRVGKKLFRVLTLKTLPEGSTYAAMIESFLKLPFYFWLTQSIQVPRQKKEIQKLQIQRRLTHSMAAGAGNVSDLESESKLGHIEGLIQELLEGSEKIIHTDLTCIIWAETFDELESKSDEVLKAFRSLGQSEGIIETLPGFDAFLQAVPGACTGLRTKKVKTSNAAHFMPVYAPWQGNRRPVCVLPNRDGALVSIDPFAPELPNWNGMVFGGSGAGKSFTLLQLILMFYGIKPRPKVVWIDNGASSQRAVEVLGGEFIDLNIHSNVRLNAFELDHGETKPSPSKIKLILAVLETILKDDDKPGLPKREKALLEEAIVRSYSLVKDRAPTMGDLRRILDEHPAPQMKAYAEILFSWTGETAYGRMLDGPSNISLTKNLTTIEIKNLADHPTLQNVFLLIFTDHIRKEASRDVSQPFLFVIDEGWKIFQTPSALSFALEAYRTFRKYNAGIWCISQNYRDFLFNQDIAAAIFPNTTSIFVLKQRRIDWKDFQERLGINDTEVEAIKSLQVSKGEYTEMFYMQDEGRAILRIVPDPLSYWVCTSDPLDKAKIARVTELKPTLSQMEILKELSREKEAA